VHMLNAKIYAPLNPRDKMPLEVTPIYFKLQRYETASAAPPAAPGTSTAQPGTDQPASAPQGQTAAPAPGDPPAQAAPAASGDPAASSPTQGVSNPPPAAGPQ